MNLLYFSTNVIHILSWHFITVVILYFFFFFCFDDTERKQNIELSNLIKILNALLQFTFILAIVTTATTKTYLFIHAFFLMKKSQRDARN